LKNPLDDGFIKNDPSFAKKNHIEVRYKTPNKSRPEEKLSVLEKSKLKFTIKYN